MDYGVAPESAGEAKKWLLKHNSSFGHFIGGALTSPKHGFKSVNPSNGETIASLSQATNKDVYKAVKAAKNAFKSWSVVNPHERAKVLYSIARLLQKNSRLFSVLESIDNGKPIRESRDIDIPLAQRHFYYHAGLAQIYKSKIQHMEPIGVCGQIIPWNFPLLMLAWKIAPALAAGNTVVLKPAEYTSLTALLFAEICSEAGVPDGVINIITGDGCVGEMLVNHPDIAKIAFTGSTEVGRVIREKTAGSGKSLTLELGGKSPFIVFDDADLDDAVQGAIMCKFRNNGQTCVCANRIYVQTGVYKEFAAKLQKAVSKLKVGDGFDPETTLGPLIGLDAVRKVNSHIDDAISKGAETIYSNTYSQEDGNFINPTILTGVTKNMKVATEETFGPLAPLFEFSTVEEVIELANDTIFGLASYFYAKDLSRVYEVAEALEYGIVGVNTGIISTELAPFGGVKQSGLGREGSHYGIDDFLEMKYVCLSV